MHEIADVTLILFQAYSNGHCLRWYKEGEKVPIDYQRQQHLDHVVIMQNTGRQS